MRAEVFNFGVNGWNSFMSLQNYVYLVRYLHPDFIIIHHNTNDYTLQETVFPQSVLDWPRINPIDKNLVKHSRFYKLLRFTYFLSFNRVRYHRAVIQRERLDEVSLPRQARISSYLNEEEQIALPDEYFKIDFTGGQVQIPESMFDVLLAEIYECFIKYSKADNSTLILTTQYLNRSKTNMVYCPTCVDTWPSQMNEFLRNIRSLQDVPLIDLDKKMATYDYLLIEDGMHFTEEGIRIKGELVGEGIWDILKERYNLTG